MPIGGHEGAQGTGDARVCVLVAVVIEYILVELRQVNEALIQGVLIARVAKVLQASRRVGSGRSVESLADTPGGHFHVKVSGWRCFPALDRLLLRLLGFLAAVLLILPVGISGALFAAISLVRAIFLGAI